MNQRLSSEKSKLTRLSRFISSVLFFEVTCQNELFICLSHSLSLFSYRFHPWRAKSLETTEKKLSNNQKVSKTLRFRTASVREQNNRDERQIQTSSSTWSLVEEPLSHTVSHVLNSHLWSQHQVSGQRRVKSEGVDFFQ